MQQPTLTRVQVKIGDRTILLRVNQIVYIQAKDKYAIAHTGTDREYLINSSLSELESQLDPACFVRIHRSYIVNIDCIAEIRSLSKGRIQIQLKTGATKLPVGRKFVQNVWKL